MTYGEALKEFLDLLKKHNLEGKAGMHFYAYPEGWTLYKFEGLEEFPPGFVEDVLRLKREYEKTNGPVRFLISSEKSSEKNFEQLQAHWNWHCHIMNSNCSR